MKIASFRPLIGVIICKRVAGMVASTVIACRVSVPLSGLSSVNDVYGKTVQLNQTPVVFPSPYRGYHL